MAIEIRYSGRGGDSAAEFRVVLPTILLVAFGASLAANIVLVVFYLLAEGVPIDVGSRESGALAVSFFAVTCAGVIYWFHLSRRRAEIESEFRLAQLEGKIAEIRLQQRYPMDEGQSDSR